MSHYDGLFHNFHSGACGCGLLLSLARALINSHYIPVKQLSSLPIVRKNGD